MRKVSLNIPTEIMDLSSDHKIKIVQEFIKSLGFESTLTKTELEQSAWAKSPDPEIAKLEDAYYENLAVPLWFCMLELFDILGLEFPVLEEGVVIEKSIGKEMLQKYPGGRWVTMKGRRVYILKDGTIAPEFSFEKEGDFLVSKYKDRMKKGELGRPEKGFNLDIKEAMQLHDSLQENMVKELRVVTKDRFNNVLKFQRRLEEGNESLFSDFIKELKDYFHVSDLDSDLKDYYSEKIIELRDKKPGLEGIRDFIKDNFDNEGEKIIKTLFDKDGNWVRTNLPALGDITSKWKFPYAYRVDSKIDIQEKMFSKFKDDNDFEELTFSFNKSDVTLFWKSSIGHFLLYEQFKDLLDNYDVYHLIAACELEMGKRDSEFKKEDVKNNLNDILRGVVHEGDSLELKLAKRKLQNIMKDKDENDNIYDKVTDKVKRQIIREYIAEWASTSADDSKQAILVQKIAQQEFGLEDAKMDHFSQGVLEDVEFYLGEDDDRKRGETLEKYVETERRFIIKFLRAQYNETQKFFKDSGVKEIYVYRGMSFYDESLIPPNLIKFTKEHDNYDKNNLLVGRVGIDLQPISSYALNPKEAIGFAKSRNFPFTIASKIPVERVLSTSRTGFGCLDESEITVLGGSDFEHVVVFGLKDLGAYNDPDKVMESLLHEGVEKSLTLDLEKSIGKEMQKKYPGGKWVTMKGRKVYIMKDGEIAPEFKSKVTPSMSSIDRVSIDYFTEKAKRAFDRVTFLDMLTSSEEEELTELIEKYDYKGFKGFFEDVTGYTETKKKEEQKKEPETKEEIRQFLLDEKINDPTIKALLELDKKRWDLDYIKDPFKYGEQRFEIKINPIITKENIELIEEGRRKYYCDKDVAYYEEVRSEDGERVVVRYTHLKPDSGYSFEYPVEEKEEGMIWRGMSAEEFDFVKKEKKIQSHGGWNIGEGQVGLTYFGDDPKTAFTYAGSFQPYPFIPTFGRSGYVVKIKEEGLETDREEAPSGEVGVRGAVPIDEILDIYEVRAVSMDSGFVEVYKQGTPTGYTFLEGSRSSPHAQLAFKKLDLSELEKSLEMDLIKADDGEKLKNKLMGDVRKRFRERLKYKPDGRPYTTRQLADIEKVIRKFHVTPEKWAESASTRAYLIGKLLATRDKENKEMLTIMFDSIPKEISRVKLPFSLTTKEEGKIEMLPLQSQELNAIEWAKLHAGEEIRTKQEEVLKGVKRVLVQSRMERWEPQRLAQELFDQFGQFNRDWRRIALTETAKAVSNGYLMDLKDGDQIIIQEAADMCPHCRRLNHGKVFTFRERPGNEKTEIWVGKTNYGKKTRDWSACVPLHPHCRGRYVKFNDVFYKMDEETGKLVRKEKEEILAEGKLG